MYQLVRPAGSKGGRMTATRSETDWETFERLLIKSRENLNRVQEAMNAVTGKLVSMNESLSEMRSLIEIIRQEEAYESPEKEERYVSEGVEESLESPTKEEDRGGDCEGPLLAMRRIEILAPVGRHLASMDLARSMEEEELLQSTRSSNAEKRQSKEERMGEAQVQERTIYPPPIHLGWNKDVSGPANTSTQAQQTTRKTMVITRGKGRIGGSLGAALKMRNLLEEFYGDHGFRPPTILGVQEHVFTGSVSSSAYFMSSQESSFVTLGQRVLANPLKVGKGKDVGLNQIALFEGKVAGDNGEQVLSRDIYRSYGLRLNCASFWKKNNLLDSELETALMEMVKQDNRRQLSARVEQLESELSELRQAYDGKQEQENAMLQILMRVEQEQKVTEDARRFAEQDARYASQVLEDMPLKCCPEICLTGRVNLALSGVDETILDRAQISQNSSLSAALNAQFLFQIGVCTAVPMVLGLILVQGFLRALVSFVTMQFQLYTVFFTFSLGTRTHHFGRTILHGDARYQATGRGFAVRHIKFTENYRLYARSHFVKGMEIVLVLVVYLSYMFNEGGALAYMGIGVKGEESWEACWDEDLSHIRHFSGRVMEIILSVRFLLVG
ncbi:hypothetical protein F511_30539 [Dorcoceras hygrometricum]|uniref:Glycosyl transferase 48 domain-containing protein n=1 Tax=Dorcoceras hygrometricum TaxID=472368 RepID=A0A2Z7BYY0_9LAMI|nr:hypothetical protein F511_30539 [Dorcoceras hygrometricum]